MARWHETTAASIGLRLAGLGILSLAWMTGQALYVRIHAAPPSGASLPDLGLCAIFVALLIVGNALLCVGPGLWREVAIPRRWSGALVEPRQFDVLLYGDGHEHHALRGHATLPQWDGPATAADPRVATLPGLPGISKNI